MSDIQQDDPKLHQPVTDPTTPVTEVVSAPRKPRKPLGRKQKLIFSAAGLVVLCFIAGIGGSVLVNDVNSHSIGAVTNIATSANDGNKNVTSQEQAISTVVNKVSPSVVSIVTQSSASSVYGQDEEEEGAGSGIIVSSNGYILTNKHVVSGASTVQVVLADGTTYNNVQVVGTDPLNDVAFLKIPNVTNLPAAELGDSSTLHVGQPVVAIGNSLGQYQNTVTSGIVSGTGRSVTASLDDDSGDDSSDGSDFDNSSTSTSDTETLTDLLQTDAAINPGNSGGPLLNLNGQVVGMNTAIAQDAQSIGFSIPIDAVKGLLKGVVATGKIERAYLGVNYIAITADVASHYKLPVKTGAYVYTGTSSSPVISGSPADKAGIQSGDIITKVGSTTVGAAGDVSTLVSEYTPGTTIQLTILRGGKTMTLNVTLGTYTGTGS